MSETWQVVIAGFIGGFIGGMFNDWRFIGGMFNDWRRRTKPKPRKRDDFYDE